jgi:hypothetical protein
MRSFGSEPYCGIKGSHSRTILESRKLLALVISPCFKMLTYLPQFVEEQAIDRVHRMTQTVDVIVYKLTISNTVEERIVDLQEKKRELAKAAFDAEGPAGAAKGKSMKLTMQDMLSLFGKNAEHTVPVATGPSLGTFNRVLDPSSPTKGRVESGVDGGISLATGSGRNSREGSAGMRKSPPVSGARKEDNVYGRRW